MNIKSAQLWATQELNQFDCARLDSDILLAHILKKNRSYLYTWPENDLTLQQLEQFHDLISTRKSGTPIAHIVCHKEFWSLDLTITADTLIPRPETELLVEQALNLIPKTGHFHIADLGTGSGAIALAIASERPQCDIVATDCIIPALDIAKRNAHKNNIRNICFIQSNWFDNLDNKEFNIIISNPPYVAQQDPLLLQGDVRFEPTTALVSGLDGLDDIKIIVKQARDYLLEKSWLVLEHGFEQQQQVQQIFVDNNYAQITTINDLSGHPRVTLAHY